jgi:hypothetical protein
MPGGGGGTISFRRSAGDSDPPDPWRTYVENPALLDRVLTTLAPGQPLLVRQVPGEHVELAEHVTLLRRIHDAGRDVVVVLDPD